MKLGIMQPYFMPYIGYFQLMKYVDKYIIYDDVNYIKGGWINRNNILINGNKKMFTVILNGASPNKLINEIFIEDDFKKIRKTLQLNYSKAPFFIDTMILFEKIVSYPDKQLSSFIANSFREIILYLNIDTEILISSDIHKNCSLKGKDKVIHMCNLMKADTYINAIGGQELYDKEEFVSHGLDLKFLKTSFFPYKQLNDNFIPYLSILDVLMFNSVEDINNMLDKIELI